MPAFEWDDGNRNHIALHSVSIAEAEQVCSNETFFLDSYEVGGEVRFEDVGATSTGRILVIVTTERGDRIRVVTAFDAPAQLKQLYLQRW